MAIGGMGGLQTGELYVDQAAATLLAFAAKVDTGKCGPPRFLAVVTGIGVGYTRPDGVQVVPIGALGP